MSEHVTWEDCPHCGGSAAVGWAEREGRSDDAERRPVEFDCPSGCSVELGELPYRRR